MVTLFLSQRDNTACLRLFVFLFQIKLNENSCQCYVCLRQKGQTISTTLPQQVTAETSRPGEATSLPPHSRFGWSARTLKSPRAAPVTHAVIRPSHAPSAVAEASPTNLHQSPSQTGLWLAGGHTRTYIPRVWGVGQHVWCSHAPT